MVIANGRVDPFKNEVREEVKEKMFRAVVLKWLNWPIKRRRRSVACLGMIVMTLVFWKAAPALTIFSGWLFGYFLSYTIWHEEETPFDRLIQEYRNEAKT